MLRGRRFRWERHQADAELWKNQTQTNLNRQASKLHHHWHRILSTLRLPLQGLQVQTSIVQVLFKYKSTISKYLLNATICMEFPI